MTVREGVPEVERVAEKVFDTVELPVLKFEGDGLAHGVEICVEETVADGEELTTCVEVIVTVPTGL